MRNFPQGIAPELMPTQPEMSDEEFGRGFAAALAEAGYDTREKIIELVREVKRELADEFEAEMRRMKEETKKSRGIRTG